VASSPFAGITYGQKPARRATTARSAEDTCYWCGDSTAALPWWETRYYPSQSSTIHEACHRRNAPRRAWSEEAWREYDAKGGAVFAEKLLRPAHRTVTGRCAATGWHNAKGCA
jgi:hypothetical protein